LNPSIYLKIAELNSSKGFEQGNAIPQNFKLARPETTAEAFTTLITEVNQSRVSVFQLKQHLLRVTNNARALSLFSREISSKQIELLLGHIINTLKNYHSTNKYNARVRLIIRENSDLEIFVSPDTPSWGTNSISICSYKKQRPHPKIKHTHFTASLDARAFAEKNNFKEALLIDEKGMVTEGAWSNIFWFNSTGKLHTTKDNILPGITRAAVMEIEETTEKEISLEQLLEEATEVFITQSTTGISLISQLDDRKFDSSTLSKKVKNEFEILKKETSLTILPYE